MDIYRQILKLVSIIQCLRFITTWVWPSCRAWLSSKYSRMALLSPWLCVGSCCLVVGYRHFLIPKYILEFSMLNRWVSRSRRVDHAVVIVLVGCLSSGVSALERNVFNPSNLPYFTHRTCTRFPEYIFNCINTFMCACARSRARVRVCVTWWNWAFLREWGVKVPSTMDSDDAVIASQLEIALSFQRLFPLISPLQ